MAKESGKGMLPAESTVYAASAELSIVLTALIGHTFGLPGSPEDRGRNGAAVLMLATKLVDLMCEHGVHVVEQVLRGSDCGTPTSPAAAMSRSESAVSDEVSGDLHSKDLFAPDTRKH